ncbi:hypothetical protein TELCIR_15817 [Teladorsagia circumcincta]|uniref:Uncharacterized protein n=1 Tax=Teladorsagia circumcincta TaxID=45464 RepID=A0A2G9TX74_TELCI|nr:hypothetical protein TELCIR_15817 [Teladorsagia circumcincta]
MADSHSHPSANDQSQRPEEVPADEEFRRELRRTTSSSPRPLRKSSVCSGPRKTSTSRRASLSPQPLRRLSVVGASDDVPKISHKTSEPTKPTTESTSESSPTQTETSKTVPSKVTPKSSHSSSSTAPLPSPKAELAKDNFTKNNSTNQHVFVFVATVRLTDEAREIHFD